MSSAPAPTGAPSVRVARNTALRAAAEVIGKVATLVLTIVMISELGAGAVGDFGFALAISQLYWPIAGFGLDRLMLREIAVDASAAGRLVPQLNAYKLVVGLLCTLVGTVLVGGLHGDATVTWTTFVLGLALVATLIGATAQAVFMAHERVEHYFVAALPVKVGASTLGIAVLLAGGGLVAVATTNLLAAGAGIVIGWWLLGRRYGVRPAAMAGTPRSWRPLLTMSGPWGLQEIFGQITFRVGIIVLFIYAGSVTTGEYRAAYQLLEATLFIPWSIAMSVLPLIARARRGEPTGDEPPLEIISAASTEMVVALMLPVGLILGFCAEPLVGLLYPDDVARAADVLPFLAAASVVYGVGHISGLVALAHLPGRRTVEATALAAAFSVTSVLLLVPADGARGAAIAALATETVLAALSLRLALRATGATLLRGIASAPVIAGLAMAAILSQTGDDLLLSVVAGGGTYLMLVLAFEYRRDSVVWALLRSIVRRRRQSTASRPA